MIASMPMGDVADFRNFMGAVIDRQAFDADHGCIERAQRVAGRRRSSPAAAPTTARAGSSSPRWCRRTDPRYR